MTELIDEIALGLCFEVHRGCRMGTYMLEDLEKWVFLHHICDALFFTIDYSMIKIVCVSSND